MENQLSPIISRSGNRAVIKPVKDITASSTPDLRAALKTLVAEGIRELEIDLIDVRVVDSSGIGLLVAAHNSLERLSGKLVVTNVTSDLMELFKAFRLERHFSIIAIKETE